MKKKKKRYLHITKVIKMFERLLNSIGLYTKKQYMFEVVRANNCEEEYEVLDDMVFGLEIEKNKFLKSFRECEELRRELIKENEELKKEIEKLRLKVIRSVKRKRR